jgi:hypothetical protein
MAQGDVLEAQGLLEEASSIATASQHRILGPVLASLADIECSNGKPDQGTSLAEQALSLSSAEYGAADWNSQRAFLTLAYCRRLTGLEEDGDAANRALEGALEVIQQRWPVAHYFVQRARQQVQSLPH